MVAKMGLKLGKKLILTDSKTIMYYSWTVIQGEMQRDSKTVNYTGYWCAMCNIMFLQESDDVSPKRSLHMNSSR